MVHIQIQIYKRLKTISTCTAGGGPRVPPDRPWNGPESRGYRGGGAGRTTRLRPFSRGNMWGCSDGADGAVDAGKHIHTHTTYIYIYIYVFENVYYIYICIYGY